ncbi:hypothetical protein [Curtobacterium sp. Curtsp57]|uniref:hypothetical protein n=1 Tax=Curtobacterium sp. Curtsp57 TaxID=3243047 RepID=UPI0039B4C353
MFADLIAATAAPTPNVQIARDAYDWWSDIWLPALTAVASLAVSAVAVGIARRSNKFAQAATKAAERSNAIARAAARQEDLRVEREAARVLREERSAFAKRFLRAIDRLSGELHAEPMLWSMPMDEIGDNALYDIGPMLFEAAVRRWEQTPFDAAVQFIRDGAKAGGGARHTQIARNAAHSLVWYWAEDPARIDRMLPFIRKDTAERLGL